MTGTEKMRTINELREQEEIVSRYELGREEGAEIDAWEDPSFEVYHVTDHYGFLHQNKIPEQSAKLDSKFLETKLNREKKWSLMVKSKSHWEKSIKSNKVAERTYKGIPEKVRGLAWCLMLGIEGVRKKNSGVYERMRDLSKKWSTYVKQIDLDINRTFREHIMFRKRYDIKQQALFNILCAYSLYDEDVGYCQGMSEVAALLLMFMNEEDAFWSFATLMTNEKHSMRGFFLPNFPKLIRFKDHHDEIVRKYLKKVKKHLDKNNIHTVTFCIKWFMQCFLDRVPFSLAMRLWDIYIWEGEGLLTAGAYTIIRLQRDRLLKLSDEEILKLFQSDLAKDFGCDDESVIRTLKLSMADLKQSNKLIPKKPEGSEGFTKSLGSFAPPRPSDFSPEHLEASSRVATLKSEANRPKSARVSIPADGGPELGVDLLIEENEIGWRTVDRFLSQECFDELGDKSENSPQFSMKLLGDDGLSSCTSLASHDYENSSFYDGDDDTSVVRDGRGSPDTLNGSNDITQICTTENEEKDNENKFDEQLAIRASSGSGQSDSWKGINELILPPPKSFLTPSRTCSDPESLHPDNSHFLRDALAFYKKIPTSLAGTNNLPKGHPGVPYNSSKDHINLSDPLTNHKMPYIQSSLNVRNESSPVIPGIKFFPHYPSNQSYSSPRPLGTPMYSTFKKNTSSNSSYLSKKVMHKNVNRDQNAKVPVKQGVSTVMIGEETDVIIGSSGRTSLFPSSSAQITNGQIHVGNTKPLGDDIRPHYNNFQSSARELGISLKEPNISNANLHQRMQHFHHSTSDLTHGNNSIQRFVSSKPLVDTGLYHPDYKGVTRIWTGSPSSSAWPGKTAQPLLLKQKGNVPDVHSSPSNKTDGKKASLSYTRF